MMGAVAASAPLYVFFGWLSDFAGRKIVMLCGMTLALVAFFPGYHALERAGQPGPGGRVGGDARGRGGGSRRTALQLDPVGKPRSSRPAISPELLANAGVSYGNEAAPAGTKAVVRIGLATIASESAAGLAKDKVKAVKTGVETKLRRR